jgi:Ca2+-binding RTX toxin-like protein
MTGSADVSAFDYTAITGSNLVIAVGATLYTVALDGLANNAAVLSAINNLAGLKNEITATVVATNLVLTLNTTSTVTIDPTSTAQALTDLGLTASASVSGEGDRVINAEWLTGGAGADELTGHTAGETIEGGAAIDTIKGGAGDDTLFGDAAADILDGEAGNDTLYGGVGADSSTGGAGDADVCEYVAGTDTVVVNHGCEVLN